MLLRNVFTRWLWDGRRSLPAWMLAIVGVGGMYAALWPTMRSPQMADAVAAYPQDLLAAFNYTDVATPAGYLGGAVYGMLVPLLVAVHAIGAGTRAVAGDENAGTLDLVLAHPVSRAGLALQRLAGVLLGVLLIAVALAVALLAMRVPLQLDAVGVGGILAMNVHLAAFGMAFGALAWALGAATGNRTVALAGGAGVALLAYLANSVLPQADALSWTRTWSPFHWYLGGQPLSNGVQWSGLAALLAMAAVFAVAGTWRFTRRDLHS